MRIKNFAFFASLVILAAPGTAHGLSQGDQDALTDTQKLLHDEAALRNFTKDNPDAATALDRVRVLTGNDQMQMGALNDISSDVFADIAKRNHGDSAAIQAELQQALKDPKAFMNRLSPEQKARISGIAAEIEKKKLEANRAPASVK